jgi:predicted transcriptional regulator
MSKLDKIIGALRVCVSKETGMGAAEIGKIVRITERDVRRCIADNYKEICDRLGGILLSESPYGFWLAESLECIRRRDELLGQLAKRAARRWKEFQVLVKQHGFNLGKEAA